MGADSETGRLRTVLVPEPAIAAGLLPCSAPRPPADPEQAEPEQCDKHDPEANHEHVQERREQHPQDHEGNDRYDDVHDDARHAIYSTRARNEPAHARRTTPLANKRR